MTLLAEIIEAEFWDQRFCLYCREAVEEGEECPGCGRADVPSAQDLVRMVAMLAVEGEEE